MSIDNITFNKVTPDVARKICQAITTTLPEWFGIPEANKRYEEGMSTRVSFAASIGNTHVGLITLENSYPNNAHLYWIGVDKQYHHKQIGRKLLAVAENYCLENGYSTLTVETVSPKQKDENYLKTYHFYEACGFKPLFELHPYDQHNLMVFMQKTLSLNDYEFIDLTHRLSSEVPHWGIDTGYKYNARLIHTAESPGAVQFRVQRLEMTAGIGTHMDAPSHCYETATAIDTIPLQQLITTCRVIDVSHKAHERYSVSIEDIQDFENQYGMIPKQSFVIIYTGWDQRWQQPETYRNEKIFPNLSTEAAKLLLSRDIVGIGIDTLSPDAFGSDFPVHQIMLGAGKYIIENVANAKQLDPAGSFIIALPIKIIDGTEAPMRLVGMKRKR